MAELSEQIKLLASQRSTLKRKVTLLQNSLRQASNLAPTQLQQLHDELRTQYTNFVECHLEYSDLVQSDVAYDAHKIVNGLDLDQYLNSVDTVYNIALDFFKKHFCKFIDESIARALETSDKLLSSGPVDARLLANHIQTCTSLADQYLSINGSRHTELHKTLVELNCAYPTDTTSSASGFLHIVSQPTPTSHTPPSSHEGGSLPNAESTRVVRGNAGQGVTDAQVSVDSNLGVRQTSSDPAVVVSGSELSLPANKDKSRDAPVASNSNVVVSSVDTGPISSLMYTPSVGRHGVISSINAYQNDSRRSLHSSVSSARNNIVTAYSDRAAPSLSPINLSDIQNSMIQNKTGWQESEYKKMSLPKFSGKSYDWPEFKAIWLRYISHAMKIGVDQVQLVYQLKQSLSGEAKDRVDAIKATQLRPLEHIFEALDSVYADIGSCVQHSLAELGRLESVKEGDYRGLIKLICAVERCYGQLAEVGQLSAVDLTHVDSITDRLPFSITSLWMNQYQSFGTDDRIHPFPRFMLFLAAQRDISQRYANRQALIEKQPPDRGPSSNSNSKKANKAGNAKPKPKNDAQCFQSDTRLSNSTCAVHENSKHATAVCKAFMDLSIHDKYEALKSKSLCFRCFGQHLVQNCESKQFCKGCKSKYHHTLLCSGKSDKAKEAKAKANHVDQATLAPVEGSVDSNLATATCNSSKSGKAGNVVFAIQSANVKGVKDSATLFFDSGANSSFITRKAAHRLRSRMVGPVTLDLTTMGGGETEVETQIYEVELVTADFSVVVVSAYCMDYITGPVSSLDLGALARLFPGFDVSILQRRSSNVDLLLGMDLEGLHPGNVLAESGPNLRVRSSPFGPVLMGSHSETLVLHPQSETELGCSLVGSHVVVREKAASVVCNLSRAVTLPVDSFIQGEELGTEVYPKCGACKCSKCPIPGHTFSFTEEQELRMIRNNLRYDSDRKHWITKYPWIVDPSTLPDNYPSALATLKHTEKVLAKDETWAKVYDSQIRDMVDRGVAKLLSSEDVADWNGPVFYLSHLAVL